MYAFFQSAGTDSLNDKYNYYMVGILYLDVEVNKGLLKIDKPLQDLFLHNIDSIVHGFSHNLKVFIAIDFNLIVHKVDFDKEFLKEMIDSQKYTELQEITVQAINSATRLMLDQFQKSLPDDSTITLKQFVDRVALSHQKSDYWLKLEGTDENAKKITFMAPYFDYPELNEGYLEELN